MAKTRKKELSFNIEDSEKQAVFLELVRKKVTMVNINMAVRQGKIRIVLSGPHESMRYAISVIKGIRNSLKNENEIL